MTNASRIQDGRGSEPRAGRLARARRHLPVLTAIGLTVVTLAVAGLGFRQDAGTAQDERDRAADQTLRSTTALTTGLDYAVESVRGLFAASGTVTEPEFDMFVSGLVTGGTVSALAWLDTLPHAERAAFEREHGGPIRGFDGKPMSRARTYQVPTHVYPEIFRADTSVLDISDDPSQAETMRRARRTGRPQASPQLPVGSPATGSFILYVPAYAGGTIPSTPTEREHESIGYAAGAFRYGDLKAVLRDAVPAGTHLSITTNGETVVRIGDVGHDPALRRLTFAGQVWDIRVAPTDTSGIGLGPLALLLGAVLTVLLTLVTRQSVRSELAARQLADLRERERDLAREARDLSEATSRSARERFRRSFEDAPIGMALSGASLGSGRLLETIESDLAGSGVDPRSLIFEVTETAAVSNIPRARAFADRLADLGCRFALDDFGAGFGSFCYLKHLPFDFLKIDGEFVRHCVSNHVDRVIVSSLVRAATGLSKRTIAEFVDDEPTIALLRDLGVDLAQGYSIGRPGPLQDWLARRDDPRAAVQGGARSA